MLLATRPKANPGTPSVLPRLKFRRPHCSKRILSPTSAQRPSDVAASFSSLFSANEEDPPTAGSPPRKPPAYILQAQDPAGLQDGFHLPELLLPTEDQAERMAPGIGHIVRSQMIRDRSEFSPPLQGPHR
ncbi:hypothetical protein NDU88_004627 [Pleurodeles waltl]|uniref:Uncharacterized protein n=1 Tax=Pleurodeles waltl TaxID=8319 RepID=A0AAV7W808_PLEWA|nr:hypothetical protein NDU88_004627 [Pleurodeles waltl]